MTRARETLTVMRAEGGRNPYLVDLGTVEEVVDLLPSARPEDRRDIARRYVTLRPADVDIGFAGRLPSSDQIHSRIAGPFWGTELIVSGRIVSTSHGGSVVRQAGWLAGKTEPRPMVTKGTATGTLVRTRVRAAPEFQSSLKAERWETVLFEMVVESEVLPHLGQVPAPSPRIRLARRR